MGVLRYLSTACYLRIELIFFKSNTAPRASFLFPLGFVSRVSLPSPQTEFIFTEETDVLSLPEAEVWNGISALPFSFEAQGENPSESFLASCVIQSP